MPSSKNVSFCRWYFRQYCEIVPTSYLHDYGYINHICSPLTLINVIFSNMTVRLVFEILYKQFGSLIRSFRISLWFKTLNLDSSIPLIAVFLSYKCSKMTYTLYTRKKKFPHVCLGYWLFVSLYIFFFDEGHFLSAILEDTFCRIHVLALLNLNFWAWHFRDQGNSILRNEEIWCVWTNIWFVTQNE